MKKFALFVVIAVLVLTSGCVFADEPAAPEAGDRVIKKDTAGNPVELETKDGLHILYMGTFRVAAVPEEGGEEKPANDVVSVFMVKANRDMTLWTNTEGGVDTKTNKFNYRNNDWCHIGGNNNTRQVEILEDIWMRVEFFHVLPVEKFGELPRVGRFNEFAFAEAAHPATKLVYKKIRVQPWAAWKEMEKKVIAMEEDEDVGTDDEVKD